MPVNPANKVSISRARERRSMPCEATSLLRRRSQHGWVVRIRALGLIVLISAWLVPVGGGACPTDARAADDHTHTATHDTGGHEHGDAHHASGTRHAHATREESEAPGSHAPAEGPQCCRSEPRAAVLTASLAADATPRVKSLPVELLTPTSFSALTAPARSRAALPGGQPPPPEPFARTRRPLLI